MNILITGAGGFVGQNLSATLEAIKPLLPPEYTSGLFWAQSQLS